MRRRALSLVVAGAVLVPAPALAQGADHALSGYLPERTVVSLAAAVPAAPLERSAEDIADREASSRMRSLEDTDRWLLATRHAELRPGVALAHFDCALGFRIDAVASPYLVAILRRTLHDAETAAELSKSRRMRARPVADDPARPSCQTVTEAQRATASHPSGSAAVGMAYALILSDLVPDRPAPIEQTGRQIAASRMICGMHYPTDVRDGALLGEQVARAILSMPSFTTDASAAREEIAAARAAGRTSPACAAERAALAIPVP
ncbi:PA-phosphatase [Brevundimonas sp. AAP58]|nr:PA-phosphatase [Brevundimonas sp. AAP58]